MSSPVSKITAFLHNNRTLSVCLGGLAAAALYYGTQPYRESRELKNFESETQAIYERRMRMAKNESEFDKDT